MHGISPYRVYALYTLLKGTSLVYYGGSARRSLSRDEGSVVSLFLNIHGFNDLVVQWIEDKGLLIEKNSPMLRNNF
jgi:hypothetical protein